MNPLYDLTNHDAQKLLGIGFKIYTYHKPKYTRKYSVGIQIQGISICDINTFGQEQHIFITGLCQHLFKKWLDAIHRQAIPGINAD